MQAETEKGKAFPKHKETFIRREISVKENSEKLARNELSPKEFLENVSVLYIHPRFYNIIQLATQRMELLNADDEKIEEVLDDFTEGILLGPYTGNRARKLSTMFFGEEWVNSF